MDQVGFVSLPRIVDGRGSLSFVESKRHVPFEIRRVYYLYDIPGGESRGAHSHKELRQVIIAASGSFDVITRQSGNTVKTYSLNRPYVGLYLPQMTWRELVNFSSGSVCLVLASHYYNETDYIRDFQEYLKFIGG
jgi:hypothetical protein